MRSLFGWGIFLCSLTGYADPKPGLKFIENKNQWPESVHFSARVPGGRMFLEPGKFKYCFLDEGRLQALHDHSHEGFNESGGRYEGDELIDGVVVEVDFIGANTSSTPQPFGRSAEYYNYFLGADPGRWASKAYAYDGVYYPEIYGGINLKVYSQGNNLKYDFIVAPGADPAQIEISYQGHEMLLMEGEDLRVHTLIADIIEKSPVAFQFIAGKKVPVKCNYRLRNNTLSFSFPEGYDACYELIIDPLLIFSTYSGSTADNWGSTATPGERGNLYSAGVTNQVTYGGIYPTTHGAFQRAYGGMYDVGILKYDSAGENLLYASYLGGEFSESPHSLVMNNGEELIVLGTTSSIDFPTTVNAIDTTYNGGDTVTHVVPYPGGSDIFIARISKDGSQLLGSTYLGGSKNDGLNPNIGILTRNYGDQLRGDIITDVQGNIFVSTVTASADFPVKNSLDVTYNGGETDALLLKINPDLSQIIWAAFIGGDSTDASHTIKFDQRGNILLAGGTASRNFPVTAGAYQTMQAGDADGWIAKLSKDGDMIYHATFTGTSSYDQVYFLDLNEQDEVYVYGQTTGAFPVTAGVYSNPNSGQFIQKFAPDLSALIFSTVFGSGTRIPNISPTAFLVNDCNNLYMCGWGGRTNNWPSDTRGMPTTADAIQRTTSGSDFYFIVLTDDASEFLYGTYLGGTKSQTHVDGGTSRFDKGGIVYHAVCSGCKIDRTSPSTSDFPTTPTAWSRENRSENCNNAAFKFDLSLLKARLQTNSIRFDMPGLNKICIPDKIVFQNRSSGGEIFEWDFGDGTQAVRTDTAFIVHQYQGTGNYTVWLKAIDHGTCQVKDSVKTTVDVFIGAAEVQDDDDLCGGTQYQLKATGGAQYAWISEDGSFQSNDQNPFVTPFDTTIYYVTIQETTGCFYRDTVQLNVIPSIIPEFEVQRESDCFSSPVIFFKNITDSLWADDQMFFDFGDGNTSDQVEVGHEFENDGVYSVKLVGVRKICVSEKTIPVTAFRLSIPNVITPGVKEGKNDTFMVRFGDTEEAGIPNDYGFKVSVAVYNRWGEKVYTSDDYQQDWSGEGLASGVYFYEVTVENHTTCRSWIQVVK